MTHPYVSITLETVETLLARAIASAPAKSNLSDNLTSLAETLAGITNALRNRRYDSAGMEK